MKIKTAFLCALLAWCACLPLWAQETNYPDLKARAESLFAEGSFAKAREVYQQADQLTLSPAEARWVAFRLADTLWRAVAATQSNDNTQSENARGQLEALIRDIKTTGEHDRVWAEVQQSLGDFFYLRRFSNDWGAAWPHYEAALDWWAGAPDLEQARARYLKIVWSITQLPSWQTPINFSYWYDSRPVPLAILENTLKIAQIPTDIAHAHFLLGMTLRNQGDWELRQRVAEEFEGALKPGKTTEWYDDTLFNYGEWMANNGRIKLSTEGNWSQEPDYTKALELFRRLTREFKKGESRYFDQAINQISSIADPTVSVSVGNIFLPDSEIQYYLNWRNVKKIELTLYAANLANDVKLQGEQDQYHGWLESIDLGGHQKVKSWTRDTKDTGEHKPSNETVRLENKLPAGAYVLEARADGKTARELVLVTDASVVLKTSGKQALVYMCDAVAGSPLPEATVKLWERYFADSHWHWRESSGKTGNDGIAIIDLLRSANNEEIYVGAVLKDRQAYNTGNNYYFNANEQNEGWRIYAFTDRPAYRPGETAQWKFIARRRNTGEAYVTPANQVIEYRIDDPRGAKVQENKTTLNAFGSAWGKVELTDKLPLGEYHVTFWNEGKQRVIGNAVLFRLEEYKLPEFKVVVQTPEENGRKKAFRLGEKVEATAQADYYFGGAVANADVEFIVHQTPFYHWWHRQHDYPWLYEDAPQFQRGRFGYGGGDQIVKRETVKTDATGKAVISFDTPRSPGQDFEYRIEARVTDASRREITGTGEVRVTGQRYYVYAEPAHNIYRPQEKVTVDFKTLDANEQPVQTEGTVKITRESWHEVWLDPQGREVKDDELRALRNRSLSFPPLPKPNDPGWQLKFRGYEHDEILTRTLKTDTNGAAQLTFTPERDGYYRVAWTSADNGKTNLAFVPPITSETTVWVATTATSEVGYRHDGVEIIADQDTFQVGQKAPVMLTVPTSDRYVLFTVEGEDLYSYQLIHVTGTVKLVELPIEEKHVPNIFLGATLVSDRQMFVDSKSIVVPPAKNFLSIEVQPDASQHQPRDSGRFSITTRDYHHEPISAEVSFGLVDESVYYIQPEYAGDPRQFYFGDRHYQRIQTGSTFNQKGYAKFVVGEDKQLIDVRDIETVRRRKLFNQESQILRERFGIDSEVAAGPADAIYAVGGVLDGLSSDLKKDKSAFNMPYGGFGGGRGMGTRRLAGNVNRMSLADAPASEAEAAAMPMMAKMLAPAAMPAGAPQPEQPAVQVRSDFRSTVFWQPDIITDKDGKATVNVTYPDSLTTWRGTARAVTAENQFGITTTNTRTRQPLIVRLEAPRFLLMGDTVTLSAVVNNNTDDAMKVAVDLDGVLNEQTRNPRIWLTVPAQGEARKDWTVKIGGSASDGVLMVTPGSTSLKVTAKTSDAKYADAMEKSFPVYEHGIEKYIAQSGKVRGDDVTVKINLPAERKTNSTQMSVQITSSMAVTMLDALPYLINFPYSCTEQTMSRFLPAAITAKTLKDLGLKSTDIAGHLFGGIEPASAAATHPQGKHDLNELDAVTTASLDRLYDFQHGDGGWGWWKEGDSDHFMTAYVVWGLALARTGGISIHDGVLNRGAEYLDKTLVEEELNFDQQAWMLHALAVYESSHQRKATPFQTKAFDNLWNNREKLNAYTRSLLALSAHNLGFNDQAKTLIANLENGVKIDDHPDTSVVMQGVQTNNAAVISTAHWGEDGIYYRWSEGGVEATAFALRALLAIDPQNKLIEPVSNWLIKNRRGAQWNNTRDTAITVLAMNDYLRASGELAPEMDYELLVNGHTVARKNISSADALSAPSRFIVDPKFIHDGENDVRIVRHSGKGPIYFAASATFFSLEEPITPAGSEIFVRRQYYKLVGRPTLLKGYVYDRESLNDGGNVKSGDRVQTVVTIEAKNNYEYLLFEDLKPAGLEAVEVRSGESLYAYELKSGAVDRKFGTNATASSSSTSQPVPPTARVRRGVVSRGIVPRPAQVTDEDHTGSSRWVYQELRDRKIALFIDKLPQGVWEIKYELRAEVPGKFHALPVTGQAMYVPEIRANSAETRITVEEAKP